MSYSFHSSTIATRMGKINERSAKISQPEWRRSTLVQREAVWTETLRQNWQTWLQAMTTLISSRHSPSWVNSKIKDNISAGRNAIGDKILIDRRCSRET